MSSELTARLAEFIAGLHYEDLPQSAVATVNTGFTDCIAVLVAGRGEPVVGVLCDSMLSETDKPESRVLLSARRSTAPLAALVNVTAAHAMDWDDYAFSNHPSAILVPTILAEAEATGASGREMVAAYVAGYEVWAELKGREPGHYHSKGWHPTCLFGPVAAAAASASLRGLDTEQVRQALSLAATHSGGLMANFGTMTKPYHGGLAAQNGVVAVRLVQAGMTSGRDALEHPTGLLHAASPEGRADRETPPEGLGVQWRIEKYGLNVKKYPTVGASQRCIDATVAVMREHAIDPGDIACIEAQVHEKHAAVMPFDQAQTALEAKFSLPFAVGCAALHAGIGLDEMRDDVVAGPAMQDMMARVTVVTTDEEDPSYPHAAPFDFVRIHVKDGRVIESDPVRRASGHADNPLSTDQLWEKFHGCVAPACGETGARSLFDLLQRVGIWETAEALPSIGETA
jgi:2-methylcitrate dehydratase PrpD